MTTIILKKIDIFDLEICFKMIRNDHECILRYFEFYNFFFPFREDKIKHLYYVYENVDDISQFYRHIHSFTDFKSNPHIDPIEVFNVFYKKIII